MANFLTWATDVLVKVDQSAAHLSDTGSLENIRRPRRNREGRGGGTEGGSLTDGQVSDYSGYGSDRPGEKLWSSDQFLDGLGDAADRANSPPPPSLLVMPHVSMTLASSGSQGTGGTIPAMERPLAAWDEPIARSSMLHAARAPSLAMENLRAVRRSMEGQLWQQPEVKAEFEDTLRQTSEVEAKVSVLASEIEKLRKHASMAGALNQQEVVSLREDAMAAQSAHSSEIHAHAATKMQVQVRESSLAAESVTYGRALSATQKHTEEKGLEARRLQDAMEVLEKEKKHLEGQLADLKQKLDQQLALVDDGEGRAAEKDKVPGGEDGDDGGRSGRAHRGEVSGEQEDENAGFAPMGLRAAEARQLRIELASWEAKVAALEGEVASVQQNAARWPSTGQREKELERRLRGLNEQLLAKQAQAESLANEKAALQLRLECIQEARRQLKVGGDHPATDLKRNKIGRSTAAMGAGGGASLAVDSLADDPAGKLRPRSTARGISDSIAQVAQTMDTLSLCAGAALQHHSFARSFIVAYVLGLHFAVFVILSLAAAQKALSG